MDSADGTRLKCSRIAVIGAGSAGLIAAKYFSPHLLRANKSSVSDVSLHPIRYLKAENCFSAVVVYEQRDGPGGLWQYSPDHCKDAYLQIPQVRPELGLEDPGPGSVKRPKAAFVTPMYASLETNIPRHLMELSDFPFKPSLPLFPKHNEVLEYLQEYARDVAHQILFSHQVTNVHRLEETDEQSSFTGWSVTSKHLSSHEFTTALFDAIIVANGHYAVPYVPDIAGLAEWSSQRPGSITHSKYFRTTDNYAHRSVAVIGNSASGIDIAAQLSEVANSPVYLSSKSASEFSSGSAAETRIRNIGEITEVDVATKSVVTSYGTRISGIDAILFCTGYFYSFPFLTGSLPSLITDGLMVNGTFQHIFLAADPTLAFLALPQKVIPFPVAEAQAAVVARAFAGRLRLPPKLVMQQWEQKLLLEKNGRRDRFHAMGYPVDADYLAMLISWADQSPPAADVACGVRSKRARRWTARDRWLRHHVPLIKRAYADKGEARHDIRSVEDLEFEHTSPIVAAR